MAGPAPIWDGEVAKILGEIVGTKYANDAAGRANYLADTLDALQTRYEIWGALMNYPRTVVVKPEDGFERTWTGGVMATGGKPLTWKPAMTATGSLKKNPRDVDQIVWVNHYPDADGDLTVPRSKSWPSAGAVIEIGLIRMNWEKRVGKVPPVELGAVRLFGKGTQPQKDFEHEIGDDYKQTEANHVLAHVFGENHGFVSNANREAFLTPRIPIGADGESPHYYLKQCASILELVLRNRTDPIKNVLEHKVYTHVSGNLMHQAVSAKQIPYATVDLTSGGQPPVMPGKTSIEDIVNVLDGVIGYAKLEKIPGIMSTGSHYDALFEEPSVPATRARAFHSANPYDALADSDSDSDSGDSDDDANVDAIGFFAAGELSPFSCSEDEFDSY